MKKIVFIILIGLLWQIPSAQSLYPVIVNGKYGFVDKTGHIVIPAEYDYVLPSSPNDENPFTSGVALMNKGGKYTQPGIFAGGGEWFYLDRTEKVLFSIKADSAKLFLPGSGYTTFCIKKLWGIVDRAGKILVKPKFKNSFTFHGGAATILENGKYGFIDSAGQFIVPPKFDTIGEFAYGLAPFKFNAKYGYVNERGKIVIPAQYVMAHKFSEGLASVVIKDSTGKERMGFIDITGKFMLPPAYEYFEFSDFSFSLAAIKQGRQYGFIDRTGKFIIPPVFNDARSFNTKTGFALVRNSNEYALIDRKMKYVYAMKEYFLSHKTFMIDVSIPGLVIDPDQHGAIFDYRGKIIHPGNAKFSMIDDLIKVVNNETGAIDFYIDKTGKKYFTQEDLVKVNGLK